MWGVLLDGTARPARMCRAGQASMVSVWSIGVIVCRGRSLAGCPLVLAHSGDALGLSGVNIVYPLPAGLS